MASLLDSKFVALSMKAEEKNNIKYLVEGNALKWKAEEKSEQLKVLKRRREELLNKKQKVL